MQLLMPLLQQPLKLEHELVTILYPTETHGCNYLSMTISQLTPVSKSAMNSDITIYIDTTFFP